MRARFPHLTARQVVDRLTATAIDKGPPGRDDIYGFGIIDLVKALTADIPAERITTSPTSTASPTPPSAASPSGSLSGGELLVGGLILLVLMTGTVYLSVRKGPS